MTMDVRMSKYEERLTKYAMAMRAIYLEMTWSSPPMNKQWIPIVNELNL